MDFDSAFSRSSFEAFLFKYTAIIKPLSDKSNEKPAKMSYSNSKSQNLQNGSPLRSLMLRQTLVSNPGKLTSR